MAVRGVSSGWRLPGFGFPALFDLIGELRGVMEKEATLQTHQFMVNLATRDLDVQALAHAGICIQPPALSATANAQASTPPGGAQRARSALFSAWTLADERVEKVRREGRFDPIDMALFARVGLATDHETPLLSLSAPSRAMLQAAGEFLQSRALPWSWQEDSLPPEGISDAEWRQREADWALPANDAASGGSAWSMEIVPRDRLLSSPSVEAAFALQLPFENRYGLLIEEAATVRIADEWASERNVTGAALTGLLGEARFAFRERSWEGLPAFESEVRAALWPVIPKAAFSSSDLAPFHARHTQARLDSGLEGATASPSRFRL
jgi:hypothetical protein